MAREGSRGARSALRLIGDPSRLLSTVQIGITLVGIVAGAFSGATLGRRLGAWLDTFSGISPYGSPAGMGLTLVGVTYLSVVMGELVPKRIALATPERIATWVAAPMQALSSAAAPAVWALRFSTETVLRALRLPGSRDAGVTEDEVRSLIAEGTKAGVFVPQEREMIDGVLRLADRPVQVIMTPRSRMVWIDVGADRATILEMVEAHRFSRLLVCDGTADHPLGVVHSRDLLPDALRGGDVTLASLMTPVLFVPERTTVLNLIERFKRAKVHMAVVFDEFGAIEGLVTPTDVLESIAGELPEEGEDSGPRIVRRADGSWLADATMPIDEVESATGIQMGHEVTNAGRLRATAPGPDAGARGGRRRRRRPLRGARYGRPAHRQGAGDRPSERRRDPRRGNEGGLTPGSTSAARPVPTATAVHPPTVPRPAILPSPARGVSSPS